MATGNRPAIGVMAEDQSDCDTLSVLIRRLVSRQVKIHAYAENGCAHLRRKAQAWMADAARKGWQAAIVVHDLDRNSANGSLNDEQALRTRLQAIPVPPALSPLICIPVEELEAWFWADPDVLAEVARRPVERLAMASPHRKDRPKEALIRLSIDAGRKPRYTTADNPRLAQRLNLELCAQRCPSFASLQQFVQRHYS